MRNHDGRAAAVYGACAAVWIGLMFYFSGQSGAESGSLSEAVTRWLFGWMIERGADFDKLHALTRKLAHAGIFAVEGWLAGMALLQRMNAKRAAVLTLVWCAAVAVLNELHQTTASGRVCSVADMVIDTCGAAAGLLFAVVVWHAFSAIKRRNGENTDITGD